MLKVCTAGVPQETPGRHTPAFSVKSAQTIGKNGDAFCSLQRGLKSGARTGQKTNCNTGNPDGYQKKGVAGEAKRIVVKTKGIAKVAQIWARRSGLRGGPSQTSLGVNKSGVEQFEWSLITLVSVAWRLLLSQELFYKYSNGLWKSSRTEKKEKSRTAPLTPKGAAPESFVTVKGLPPAVGNSRP